MTEQIEHDTEYMLNMLLIEERKHNAFLTDYQTLDNTIIQELINICTNALLSDNLTSYSKGFIETLTNDLKEHDDSVYREEGRAYALDNY